ncbi:MAG: PD-(D/E)XK nuclease family protein [Coxiellaceae bacterium]|jgi:hypothetical protein|nr:PD-(D/E)XK nuclease family protein [Coxiellaceae bacterium]
MQEESVTLTPNKRLARYLQKQFSIKQAKHNKITWPSKKILPVKTWLATLWRESPDSRILLTNIQEKLLWRKIITENLKEVSAYFVDSAINFHKLVNCWQIKEQNNSFKDIYNKFIKYCRDNNFITIHELPHELIPYLTNYTFKRITLVGFDEYYPQLQTLMEFFIKQGCKIIKSDPNHQLSIQKRIGFNDNSEEIICCATWTKKIIESNPEAIIGIVVPDLVILRRKIMQIFNEILGKNTGINISEGIPLNTLPIINFALKGFSMIKSLPIKFTQFSPSPYTAIKQLNKLEWQTLAASINTSKRYCSEWMLFFTKILELLGWPGTNNLTDIETIAIKHFIKALQEFATIDHILNQVSYTEALNIFHDMLNEITVTLKSNHDSQINIIGTLEAIGINFNYLWIMNMDQEHWPKSPEPNPFIPITLQKKLSLPHSSYERELYFAKIITKRYQRSAKKIIFSYIKQDGVEASSLILDVPEITIENLKLEQSLLLPQKIFNSKKLEILEDNFAPILEYQETIRASSRLIELQASCPFRAFMEFRLAIQPPQKICFGISKIDRGIIIHSILEHFWRQIKTQKNLQTLNQNEIQSVIQKNIKDLHNLISCHDQPYIRTLYKLEKQWLTTLLIKWLEVEKKRQPFEVVAIEKSTQIKLSSLTIKLRIDRIDRIANHKTILIDYKTGGNFPFAINLFEERPQYPQLLLYILAIKSITGLAFAHINNESMKFRELNLDELFSNLCSNKSKNDIKTWSELIKYWKATLDKIANEFVSGKATPEPLSREICRQCNFDPICRIKT